jgi:hypothetical protein
MLSAFCIALLALSSTAQDLPFQIRVVGPNHEQIQNAEVEIGSGSHSLRVKTNADGIADLPNVALGRNTVHVSAAGFKTWNDESLVVTPDRSILVTLEPATLGCDPDYKIRYRIEPGPPVQGIVLGQSDSGVRGISIRPYLPGEKKPILKLHSQKKGHFEIPQIPAGRYRLRITNDPLYQDEQIDLVVPTQDTLFLTIKLAKRGSVDICL